MNHEDASTNEEEAESRPVSVGTWPHVFLVSLKLGLTCFGGPIAHLGYFHQEFVVRRKWLPEREYADLVVLCQLLPGPTSSQVNLIIGMYRAGWRGALAAWTGFTLPSAMLMIGFAYGLDKPGVPPHAGWLEGLKLVAVAIVAQAVITMALKFCRGWVAAGIAAAGALVLSLAWSFTSQLLVVLVAAGLGWFFLRQDPGATTNEAPTPMRSLYGKRVGAVFFLSFFLLLAGLPVLQSMTTSPAAAHFDAFYRAGSLVFGGGHVVLPLLRSQVVDPGWIGEGKFLAGYAAAQALPGPLFSFSAFLGTAIQSGPHRWIDGWWCLFAIFLPSFLLVFGTLPFWESLRRTRSARAAFRGTNAVVVGMLLAAFYNPVWTCSIHAPRDFVFALVAFGCLVVGKVPPWLVVAAAALAGKVAFG